MTTTGGRHRVRRWVFAVAVVGFACLFVAANRSELPGAWREARHANPVWLGVGTLLTGAWLVLLSLFHGATQRAVGVEAAPLRELFPAVAAGHTLNLVTKSGGMAGVVALTALGRRHRQPEGGVVAAYVVTGLVGDVAFAATLAVALAAVWADGHLTAAEAVAGALFTIYLLLRVGVVVAAFGDRERARRLLALPSSLWARFRGRAAGAPDHRRADELHDAVEIVRRRPRAVLAPCGFALMLEATGVAVLWSVLAAVGAPGSVLIALVGYAISVLFSIVGFVPGGLGLVEVSLGAVLISFGTTRATATAAVLLYRLLELWLPAAGGAVAAQLLRRRGLLR